VANIIEKKSDYFVTADIRYMPHDRLHGAVDYPTAFLLSVRSNWRYTGKAGIARNESGRIVAGKWYPLSAAWCRTSRRETTGCEAFTLIRIALSLTGGVSDSKLHCRRCRRWLRRFGHVTGGKQGHRTSDKRRH